MYTFIQCLGCLDPILWAGSDENPAVLEGWEVERVVNLLNSEDPLVQKQVSSIGCTAEGHNFMHFQTLRILLRVDRSIVEGYYEKIITNIETDLGSSRRCLQVAEVLSGGDGESYAQHLTHVLRVVKDDVSHRHLLQDAVQMSLTHIRDGGLFGRFPCGLSDE